MVTGSKRNKSFLFIEQVGNTGGGITGDFLIADELNNLGYEANVAHVFPTAGGVLKAITSWRYDYIITCMSSLHNYAAVLSKLTLSRHIRRQCTPYTDSRRDKALRFLSKNVCASHYIRGFRRALVLYSPIEFKAPACSMLEDSPLITVGFVGSYQKRKRPDFFAQIATILHNRFPDRFRFVMAGRDDYFTRDGIQTAFDVPIKQCGQTYNAKDCLIPYCNIIVVPALAEGMGRVPLEAAYHNVRYIATDSGGHRETANLLRSEQNLCAATDPAAWADQILLLLEKPAKYNRGAFDLFTPRFYCQQLLGELKC